MDVIIRNAKLRDRDGFCDIGIQKGVFTRIQEKIEETAPEEIDANFNLVSPPL